MPSDRVLLTGATGHLGANLVRELLGRGERVRVLLRKGSCTQAVDGLEVERAEGDLRDEASLARAVVDVDRVFHVAALISIRMGDRAELVDVNVNGTRRLLRAARAAGVRRFVHTSSFGAVGHNRSGPSNEDFFLDPFEPVMDYERSKAEAEHEVFREALLGLDACIVNPTAIVGPWDFKPSLVGRTILDFAHGRLPAYVPGAFDWVPARDVVSGLLLAMEKGRRAERYIVSGEDASIDQILDWLHEFTGARRPRVKIPPRVMQSVALIKDWVEREYFPHRVPRFNYHSIRILNSGKRADKTKACRELGLRPTSLVDAFHEHVRWFREYGMIRSRPSGRVAPSAQTAAS